MSLKDPNNPSGPIVVKGMGVKVDRDLCIGAATCVAVAAKAFDLDTEAKAVILDSVDEETREAIIEAAKACPTAAIIIVDEKGNKIFPE
ncbi:MAG: ferredoxin [bacterium]|nr:ferredoxin [bacterium]